jgi:hypothetical protein
MSKVPKLAAGQFAARQADDECPVQDERRLRASRIQRYAQCAFQRNPQPFFIEGLAEIIDWA